MYQSTIVNELNNFSRHVFGQIHPKFQELKFSCSVISSCIIIMDSNVEIFVQTPKTQTFSFQSHNSSSQFFLQLISKVFWHIAAASYSNSRSFYSSRKFSSNKNVENVLIWTLSPRNCPDCCFFVTKYTDCCIASLLHCISKVDPPTSSQLNFMLD